MHRISLWSIVRKPATNYQGFTLIELLVAISIVGVLAAVAIASLGQIQKSGRNAERESDLRTLQSALQQYYTDKNYYPNASPPTELARELSLSSGKIYLNNFPTDPITKANYLYTTGTDSSNLVCDNTNANPALRCHYYQICADLEGKPQFCVKPNN